MKLTLSGDVSVIAAMVIGYCGVGGRVSAQTKLQFDNIFLVLWFGKLGLGREGKGCVNVMQICSDL